MASSAPEDLVASLTKLVREATTRYLAGVKLVVALENLPIDLRFSAQTRFGDYSMPIMALASKQNLGRPALEIAEALGQLLREAQHPAIAEITVTSPGFLNFRLNRPAIGQAIIARVLEAGPDYGQNTVGRGTKVIVEHTAINSNKAAHVGHLRNASIGDTVVRMLRSQPTGCATSFTSTAIRFESILHRFSFSRKRRCLNPCPWTSASVERACQGASIENTAALCILWARLIQADESLARTAGQVEAFCHLLRQRQGYRLRG